MPEFLKTSFLHAPSTPPLEILARLLVAFALGAAVAWIYRCTRKSTEIAATFPTTLVLLAVLIAMVTQVIGDNVARAFSLVGALSIVRFRTVVRDTQDTAYVIFAVIVGMAVGANDLWLSVIGLVVVGFAAFLMMLRAPIFSVTQPAFILTVRMGSSQEIGGTLNEMLNAHLLERELVSVGTARQGAAMDVVYEARLRRTTSADTLVRALTGVAGVQGAEITRRGFERR